MVHLIPSHNLVANIGYGADATHTNFASPVADLETFDLGPIDTNVPLLPDKALDDLIFFVRYLDSLRHTYWLEQVLDASGALSHERCKSSELEIRVKELTNEVLAKRRQLASLVNK